MRRGYKDTTGAHSPAEGDEYIKSAQQGGAFQEWTPEYVNGVLGGRFPIRKFHQAQLKSMRCY
jgi:hypothetical protein